MSTTGGIKVFSGNANPKLAEEIARHLGCDMGRAITERFSDGEFNFQIDEKVCGGGVQRAPDLPPNRRAFDGVTDNARCLSSFVGRTHHRRYSVLRLRTL